MFGFKFEFEFCLREEDDGSFSGDRYSLLSVPLSTICINKQLRKCKIYISLESQVSNDRLQCLRLLFPSSHLLSLSCLLESIYLYAPSPSWLGRQINEQKDRPS